MHRETVVGEFTQQAESFNTSGAANMAATLDELVALARPEPTQRWVDLACGPGVVTRAMAPHVKEIVGVDMTPTMLMVAKRESVGLDHVTYVQGDATACELPSDSFDGAINRFAIHHIPVPARLIDELARLVRPGGTVVISDHLADEDAGAVAWSQEIERLRDPSHWASLPVGRLRKLATDAGLALEEERITTIGLDFEDWLARGTGGAEARPLIDRLLAAPPRTTRWRVTPDGVLELTMWLARYRVT